MAQLLPIELCLEDLTGPDVGADFLRCVALQGGLPGLGLGDDGLPTWLLGEVGCELFVALDGRLVLLRNEAGPSVRVERAWRQLDVPAGKPVFVLQDDELTVGGRRWRLHVHGTTEVVHAPEPLAIRLLNGVRKQAGRAAVVGAAALATVAVDGCKDKPAVVVQPPEEVKTQAAWVDVVQEPQKSDVAGIKSSPIEVRDHPPKVSGPADPDVKRTNGAAVVAPPAELVQHEVTIAREAADPEVAAVLRRKNSALVRCYEDALRHDPKTPGAVTVKFTVAGEGIITEAEISGTTSYFADCITAKFMAIRGLPIAAAPRKFVQEYQFKVSK